MAIDSKFVFEFNYFITFGSSQGTFEARAGHKSTLGHLLSTGSNITSPTLLLYIKSNPYFSTFHPCSDLLNKIGYPIPEIHYPMLEFDFSGYPIPARYPKLLEK